MSKPLFARIGVWAGSPEELERWAEQTGRVKSGVSSQPGAAGAYFLLDRESGRALTLTLWESEEARQASESFRSQSQAGTAERTGAHVATERYEVVDWFATYGFDELVLKIGEGGLVVDSPREPDLNHHPAGYRPLRARVTAGN
jgi:heme-degrading monooxygenase HmoA